MAVLLDTSTLPPEQRADAVRSTLRAQLPPAGAWVAEPGQARISHWRLGDGVQLLQTVAGPSRLTVTAGHLPRGAPQRISPALPIRGAVRMRHRHLPRGDRIGERQLAYLTSPYDFLVAEPSAVEAVLVHYQRLGLPVEAVRDAVPRLA